MNKYIKVVLYSVISSLFVIIYSSMMSNISLSSIVYSISLCLLVVILLGFILVEVINDFKYIYSLLKQYVRIVISRYSVSLEFKTTQYETTDIIYDFNFKHSLSVMRC